MTPWTWPLAVLPDCPHRAAAEALLHQALRDVGLRDATVQTITISDLAAARRHRFAGSPTFLVEGTELFPTAATPGLACRIYQTPEGPAGLPSLVDLRRALEQAFDAAATCAQQSPPAPNDGVGDGPFLRRAAARDVSKFGGTERA